MGGGKDSLDMVRKAWGFCEMGNTEAHLIGKHGLEMALYVIEMRDAQIFQLQKDLARAEDSRDFAERNVARLVEENERHVAEKELLRGQLAEARMRQLALPFYEDIPSIPQKQTKKRVRTL